LRFELRSGSSAVAHGRFARLGSSGTFFEITSDDEPYSESAHCASHTQALRYLVDYLQRNALIASLAEIELIAHRVAHGGAEFRHTTAMEQAELARLRAIAHLSPDLPASIETLHAGMRQLPGLHVAVFDTAFMATIVPEAAHYALAPNVAGRFQLRRYGFHGIVHKAAYDEAMGLLRRHAGMRRPRRVISIHIGDDVSVTALYDGIVRDTSTGFTPAEGLPGLHRSGSVDPRIPLHLAAHLRATPQQVDAILSTRSGMAAMAKKESYDDILAAAGERDPASVEALMHLSYRIAKEAAGMTAVLGGVDMIVFSGDGARHEIREEVCRRLSHHKAHLACAKSVGVLSAAHATVIVVGVKVDDDDALLAEAASLYRVKKALKRTL
jgi:acetate kinase